ncbi:MAG: insulinase family protein [Betaproteobacteria bacterium]|nr:MAG: insulinase family protein [Betaproteobacteria bacterium]
MTIAFPRFVFGGLLLLAAAAALAQALPERTASVEGVTEYRLANGLRVLTVPDPSADTVTVHLAYLVGSRHEGYGEKGMAHLLEHLLFKSSLKHPNISLELDRRGARHNATTAFDRTTYFETLPASDDNLDWALGLEADRMVNATFSPQDLASEMTVVRNEFEMRENDPGGVLFERMQRLAYAWHNYGNAIIGNRADIERVPIERLRAFYRTWYQPDNAVLILGGRFDEARALERVAHHFGALPRPARALPELYTIEPTQDGERSVTLRRTGDTQMVAALYRVPAAADPDYPALELLVHALGAAPAGRLHRALVQKGLASTVWGGERAMHDPGFVHFGAALGNAAALEPARDALLAVLEGIAREPIRADEVERARTALLGDIDKTQTDLQALIRWLSEFAALGDWRLFYLYRDRLQQAGVADVQRVAERYLRPANRVLGLFIPTAQPERAEIPLRPDVGAAVADYKGREAPASGEAFDPTPQNVEARLIRRELPNGIRLALLPKKTRGATVQAVLALYWGDEASKADRATACSLAGGLLMRGTRRHNRTELRDAFDKLKATVQAGVSGAGLEARRDSLEPTLRLLAEVLREPAFPADEFEQLRRARLTSAESQLSDPEAIADERLQRHLAPYPRGHWLAPQSTAERIAELNTATLEEARRCYGDLVGATGATFVAVGDFDPEALTQLVAELFGDWQSPRPFTRIANRHFDQPRIDEEVRTPDKANAALRAGLNLKLRDDHPDFPALVLGSYLLGGTSTARLPARIREKDGLSYSIYSHFSASSLDESASFGIEATFAPQNKQRVEQGVAEELARALAEGFSEDEVAAAKKSLLDARRLGRARDRTLAGRLSNYTFLGRRFDWDVDFESRIAALTPVAVHDALRRHLDPAKLSVLKAGDFR